MRCYECYGDGVILGVDESDDEQCGECHGRGWVFFSDWAYWKWARWSMPLYRARVRFEDSRLGFWWWRTVSRHWRAWRLSRYIRTEFEAHARHGHRLNQLERFKELAAENDNPDTARFITFHTAKQRRLCWESDRAIRLVRRREESRRAVQESPARV